MGENIAKERPDYEIAREELRAAFAKLALGVTISDPLAGVDPPAEKGRSGWPHVAFVLTFQRGGAVEAAPFKMGIGLFPWDDPRVNSHPLLRPIEGAAWIVERMRSHNLPSLKDPLPAARLAAAIAKITGTKPDPAEVFGNLCRDGLALFERFEDWAADYGYDEDSRRAEETYRKCCDCGRQVLRFVDVDEMRKFADLSGRL